VAEEAVLMIGRTRSRCGADVMRALIVIDENGAGRKIVRILRMRQCHPARNEADEQESRNANPLNPRLRAEHPNLSLARGVHSVKLSTATRQGVRAR
jgi:hypothetical protein